MTLNRKDVYSHPQDKETMFLKLKQLFWRYTNINIVIINRKYLIGGKWVRFEKMIGVKLNGYKIAIGKYEIRFYFKHKENGKSKNRNKKTISIVG